MAKCGLCDDTGCYGTDSHGVQVRCRCQDGAGALGQTFNTRAMQAAVALVKTRAECLTRPTRVARYEPEAVVVRCGTVTIDCDGCQARKAKIAVEGQDLSALGWKSFRLEGSIPGPITLTVEFVPRAAVAPECTVLAEPQE